MTHERSTNRGERRDPNGRLRWAVVGLGNIAQVAVLPAFAHARENCQLVALVSSDAEKRKTLSQKYDVEHTGSYEDLEAVLHAAQARAVYLALPNSMHREFTERAAAFGAHVLCEKPMATTVEDCEAMIAACRKAEVRLMIAYRLDFDRANVRAIEHLRRGDIGEPRLFSSVFGHRVREGDVRTRGSLGGGALLDLGVYCIHAARALFGEEPIEVRATQIHGGGDVDATTAALLRFGGDRIAQLLCSQEVDDVSEWRVIGTKGHLRLEPAYDYARGLREYWTVGPWTHIQRYGRHDQFAPELVHFAEAVLDGKAPEPSGEVGLRDVRIIEAIRSSARTSGAVPLAPYPAGPQPTPAQTMTKPPVQAPTPIHAPSPSK